MSHKVLLLDDDNRFRKMVVPGLAAKEISVVESGSGRDALAKLRKGKFDLLIVDNVLPDIDGINWISEYRASGGKIPIVLVSARWLSPELYRELAEELQVCLVIHKPVVPRVFAEQISGELLRAQWDDLSLAFQQETDTCLAGSFEALRREYFDELPLELDKMAELFESAKTYPESRKECLHQLRMHCHRLRGTAGSFGLQSLGDLMGELEDRIRTTQKGGLQWDEAFCFHLAERLIAARQILVDFTQVAPVSGLPVLNTDVGAAYSRILVLDNDERFLEAAMSLSKQRLVRISIARNREQALSILKAGMVQAVLLDIHMKGEEPFELARAIKDLTGEDVPIAVVSEESGLDDNLLAAHLGASLYLSKPIDQDRLDDAVQRLIILSSVQAPRILIVDNDLAAAQRMSALLSESGMETAILTESSLLLEKLHEFNPDLLILELILPRISGFDLCRILRTLPAFQDLPVLFVNKETNLETRIAAFSCGADDYLLKPIADEELLARVSLRVERSRLLRERNERDPVSGLLLRRGFLERFNSALASARRSLQNVSLILFDLDYFKRINDVYGHLAGDATLSGLGRLLLRRFRIEDLRGRWGGDEFVLALVGSSKEQALKLMKSFIAEFAETDFQGEKGQIFRSTLSAGISGFPEDGENTYELLKVADKRLYEAKTSGRNRVVADLPVELTEIRGALS